MPPITTVDYIYAVCSVIVLVLVGVILVQLILILRKALKMVNKAESAMENVENFVARPLKIALQFADQIQHIVGMVQQKTGKKRHDDDDEV